MSIAPQMADKQAFQNQLITNYRARYIAALQSAICQARQAASADLFQGTGSSPRIHQIATRRALDKAISLRLA